ncbi:MAG TPA: CBS domain-containing protein [Myxococcota bacterium]|nr:CBS domain-containing protein [Myxococcota bacterium]
MKIEDLMRPDPCCCSRQDMLNDATRIMWEQDCGFVPVVEGGDGSNRLVGVITDRDVCMAAYTTGKALGEIPVEAAMSKDIHACSPDSTILAAEKTMREAQVRRLPVVDAEGRVVGVLSLADLAREVEREHVSGSRDVTDRELGTTFEAITRPREATPTA